MSVFTRRMTGSLVVASAAAAAFGLAVSTTAQAAPHPGPPGIDVSHHNGKVDWPTVAKGQKFTYVKATQRTDYVDPTFGANYDGSAGAGMIRGAYHFAEPDTSDGAAQANWFVDHGGGWKKGTKTLPGALDLESGEAAGKDKCYGMSPQDMVGWIHQFADQYKKRTGRDAVIYTGYGWWDQCTGGNGEFKANPLWHADTSGKLPQGFDKGTIWQYDTEGKDVPGVPSATVDKNEFQAGDDAALARFANGE